MKSRGSLLLSGLILLAGCTGGVPAPAELGMEEPSSSAAPREEEETAPAITEPKDSKSTPKLHFAKGSMSTVAPSGAETAEDSLAWRWSFLSPPYLGFRHIATNNGTITRANATLWFKVTELTPADAIGCHFALSMRIISNSGAPSAGRFLSFCSQYLPDSALPIPPGTYKVEAEAYIGQPIPIQYGDAVVFMPQTGGVSLEQRKTVSFLYNSRAHDSVVQFEGWEEGSA